MAQNSNQTRQVSSGALNAPTLNRWRIERLRAKTHKKDVDRQLLRQLHEGKALN